ncbi:NADAR family protein [Paraflavitalea sp. CAU 1676]|uniref:NADAR family protein n=1 Tax=Paraflavitalea sp. CAU 1676 TaxID=3032598 RepID=UPI0023DB5865|nr:NADAR family protein [Paraflavitalea sp. CAU 1676]MDF2191057.1 NADAR family protein [Paraflavitalea sp. CAU 1676]
MKYSLEILRRQVEAGQAVEYFYFWGHTPKQAGTVDKSCLSQWFPASFEVDGVTYLTAEHWMMAHKALLFGDREAFEEVISCIKPAVAKEIGRKVRNFDDATWKEKRYAIVVEGSYHKFSQHEELRQFLLYTGQKIIVEASPRDRIWGIGMGQNNPDAMNPFKWRGGNLLGFALMEARDRLLS